MVEPTVGTPYIRHLLATAQSLGVDVPRAMRFGGIVAEQLDDPDARIALQSHHRLWRHLSSEVGRETLGFAAGRRFQPEALGVAGHVVSLCNTGVEAIATFARYRSLIGDDQIVPHIQAGATHVEVRYAAVDPVFAEHAHSGESGMVSLLILATAMSGIRCAPVEVWFQHKRPADLRPYEEFFPCRLRFEMPLRRLLLPRDVGEVRWARADGALYRYLTRHADALVERLRPDRSVADRVRDHLLQVLAKGQPQQDLVARALGMSTRTLQRYLRREGVSFAEILDDVRHQLALAYLRERTVSVGDVAFLLGYAEPSAFFRAFRRWTGTTPRLGSLLT
jgi:AraC-like DNA-binding protein